MARGIQCRCGYDLVSDAPVSTAGPRECSNPVHPARPKCPRCGDVGPHRLLAGHMRCRACHRTFDPERASVH